jgi:hypothetical protein
MRANFDIGNTVREALELTRERMDDGAWRGCIERDRGVKILSGSKNHLMLRQYLGLNLHRDL